VQISSICDTSQQTPAKQEATLKPVFQVIALSSLDPDGRDPKRTQTFIR
jgi:hypothetical protein